MEKIVDLKQFVKKSGDRYYRNSQFKQALEKYLDAVKLGMSNSGIYFMIASLVKDENEEEAIKYLDKALELDNSSPCISNCNFRKGELLMNLKRYEDALKVFLIAEKEGMHYEWLYYGIMYCLLKKENEFSDMLALKYAKKIAAIDIPLGYYYQGYIYWSREKYDIALKLFLKAEQYGGSHCNLFTRMADIYERLGDYEKSLIYTNKALSLDSQHAMAHFEKGIVYNRQENFTKAINKFLLVEKLDPTIMYLYEWIADSYFWQGGLENFKMAFKYTCKAIKRTPNRKHLYWHKKICIICIICIFFSLTFRSIDFFINYIKKLLDLKQNTCKIFRFNKYCVN